MMIIADGDTMLMTAPGTIVVSKFNHASYEKPTPKFLPIYFKCLLRRQECLTKLVQPSTHRIRAEHLLLWDEVLIRVAAAPGHRCSLPYVLIRKRERPMTKAAWIIKAFRWLLVAIRIKMNILMPP